MEFKDFDFKVNIDTQVLPREMPKNVNEEVEWKRLSSNIQFQAKILSRSLEIYFEELIKLQMR